MECVDAAALDICREVTLETGRVEDKPKGAVVEDAIPVGTVAEHLAALTLGEDSILLALVGLAGLGVEGGGEGDLDEEGEQPKHCFALECGESCRAPVQI